MKFVQVRIGLQLIRHVKQSRGNQRSKFQINPSSYARDIVDKRWSRTSLVRIYRRNLCSNPSGRYCLESMRKRLNRSKQDPFESIKVDSVIFVSIRTSPVRIQRVRFTWSTSNRWVLSRFETIEFPQLRIDRNRLRSSATLQTLQAFICFDSVQSVHFDSITWVTSRLHSTFNFESINCVIPRSIRTNAPSNPLPQIQTMDSTQSN